MSKSFPTCLKLLVDLLTVLNYFIWIRSQFIILLNLNLKDKCFKQNKVYSPHSNPERIHKPMALTPGLKISNMI